MNDLPDHLRSAAIWLARGGHSTARHFHENMKSIENKHAAVDAAVAREAAPEPHRFNADPLSNPGEHLMKLRNSSQLPVTGSSSLPSIPRESSVFSGATSVFLILIVSSVVARALDDNGDGLSDVWQRVHEVATGSGAEDPDGDGFTNLQENLFGTNPFFNGAPIPFTDTYGLPTVTTYDGFLAAEWQTVLGVRYQLQRSDDSTNWQNAGSAMVGTGGRKIIYSPAYPVDSTPRLFYRLIALAPDDMDADGLNSFEEALLGTSDTDSDSDNDLVLDVTEFRMNLNPASAASNDGDTIPDDWEVYNFGNASPQPQDDPDSDGFTNLDEFTFDLDPNDNDFTGGAVTHAYTYDDANRLLGVNSVLSESFTYDPEGNLINSH